MPIVRGVEQPEIQPPSNDDGSSELLEMKVLHLQRFGINVSETWPEPNEDGTYPNDEDENNTEKPDEIDDLITDQDVDPDTDEPEEDEEDLCGEPVAGDYCQAFIGR